VIIVSTQNPPNPVGFGRKTLKELGTLFLFLITAVLVEFVVVVYAMSLGVKDQSPLQWSSTFPGTGLNLTFTISPLFHLVPIAVILTLFSSWTYLKRQVITKPGEPQRGKPSSISKHMKEQKKTVERRIGSPFSRKEKTMSLAKVRSRRTNLRSALIVLTVFLALLVMISLLTYPMLLCHAVGSIYENNPSLISFSKSVAAALAPVGAVFSSINNALLAASPIFRDFVLTIGLPIEPLATLDDAGKYLVFQNAAAWISAFIVLFYGKYGRKASWQTRK
jgi:hypothetical protein